MMGDGRQKKHRGAAQRVLMSPYGLMLRHVLMSQLVVVVVNVTGLSNVTAFMSPVCSDVTAYSTIDIL